MNKDNRVIVGHLVQHTTQLHQCYNVQARGNSREELVGTNQLHRILGLLVTTFIATVYIEMFTRRKFSTISLHALIGKNVIMRIFCPVLNAAQRIMVIFTTLARIFPANFFSNTNIHVARVGQSFIQQKFSRIQYTHMYMYMISCRWNLT